MPPLVAAVVILAGLTGCDLTGVGDLVAAIEVEVWVGQEGIPGVAVGLYEPEGSEPLVEDTTGPAGSVLLDDLSAGNYEVGVVVSDSIPLAGGQPERVPVSVFGGQTVTMQFQLTPASDVVLVHLTADTTFSPAELTIERGKTVRWFNDAAVTHTVTPDGHTEWTAATLDGAGESFTHRFEFEGTFSYYSEPYLGQGMTGTITVVAP